MHRWCLNCLNGIELGINFGMFFFEELFHSMGIDDLKGSHCDSLELMLLVVLLKMHGQLLKIHEGGTESV
jgi:hypothetical protein